MRILLSFKHQRQLGLDAVQFDEVRGVGRDPLRLPARRLVIWKCLIESDLTNYYTPF